MLDQSQETQQDKEVSQSQTEANMRLIVNNMEAQHAIAAPNHVKPQKAIKATKEEDNEEYLLTNPLTDVMIYNKPSITTGGQLDEYEAEEKNISLKNPTKVTQGKRTGGRSRIPQAAKASSSTSPTTTG